MRVNSSACLVDVTFQEVKEIVSCGARDDGCVPLFAIVVAVVVSRLGLSHLPNSDTAHVAGKAALASAVTDDSGALALQHPQSYSSTSS